MHIAFGQFLTELWPLVYVRIVFMLNILWIDFDPILYMHWYWQDVDLDDFFSFIFNRVMAFDWCWNFVYAQYLVDQLMDFDKFCKCIDIDKM